MLQVSSWLAKQIAKEETMDLGTRPTAEEVKATLGLKPHPTCGFVAETYRSPLKVPADALPEAYEADRPYGSALYFLVAPDAQIVMHRIRSDQFYHHYMGDPLEVLMLYPDGTGAVAVVGSYQGVPSTPRAWHPVIAATRCWRARSGLEWSRQTSNTETSRRWSKPTLGWASRYAPSPVE
jgi:predicted cupin superfamily sugar epimerase